MKQQQFSQFSLSNLQRDRLVVVLRFAFSSFRNFCFDSRSFFFIVGEIDRRRFITRHQRLLIFIQRVDADQRREHPSQRVIIFGRNWFVLVIVTPRARDRHSKQTASRHIDQIVERFQLITIGERSGCEKTQRRHFGIARFEADQVGGELFAHKVVERLVLIE